MKKLKIMLIIISTLLITGCSANYTLTIDENLKFTEEVTIKEGNTFFSYYNQTTDQYINDHKETYENDEIYKKFKYKTKTNANGVTINARRKNMNLETFNNESVIYETLFSSIQAIKEENRLTIKTTDYNITFFEEPYLEFEPTYDSASFTIKTPFKVIQSNADIVDAESGIYTWKFDKNSTAKNIEIVLDTQLSLSNRLLIMVKRFWYIPCVLVLLIIGYTKFKTISRKNNEI